jgi:hypothetical protein
MLAMLTIRQLDFNIGIPISTKHDVDFSVGGTSLGGGLFVLSLDQPLKLNYLLAQRSFLKKVHNRKRREVPISFYSRKKTQRN